MAGVLVDRVWKFCVNHENTTRNEFGSQDQIRLLGMPSGLSMYVLHSSVMCHHVRHQKTNKNCVTILIAWVIKQVCTLTKVINLFLKLTDMKASSHYI